MGRLALVVIVLLGFACNGGDEEVPTPSPTPSPPPAITLTPQPTYPPKVSLIERGVYLIRPDGTDLRHLTPEEEGLYYFRWSPGGSRIAVVTSACNAPRVSVIDVEGGGAVQVAAFDGSVWGHEWIVWGLKWSPDGRQLAVPARRYEEGAPYRTYLVNADGSGDPVELFEGFSLGWSPDGESLAFFTQSDEGVALNVFDVATHSAALLDKGWSSGYLAWSPDGGSIAYSIYPTDTTPEEVVVIDRDGGNRRVVGPGGSHPAWSPDGKNVAFSLRAGPGGWIAVAPADGSQEYVRLAPGDVFRWSPKGDAILVLHGGDRGSSLSLVSLATGEATELAGDIQPGASLAFSPDGERLVFQGEDPQEEAYNALYVVNADGTGLEKLVRPSTAIGARAEWSPDGRYIAFVDTIITSCP